MTKEKPLYHIKGILVTLNDECEEVDRYTHAYSEKQAIAFCEHKNRSRIGNLRDYTIKLVEEEKVMSLLLNDTNLDTPNYNESEAMKSMEVTNCFTTEYKGRDIKVEAVVGYVSPDDRTKLRGTVRVIDDGTNKKSKEAFFIWNTTKYARPSIWIDKKLVKDVPKVNFVMFLLKEFKQARIDNRLFSNAPVKEPKISTVEAPAFTPIDDDKVLEALGA